MMTRAITYNPKVHIHQRSLCNCSETRDHSNIRTFFANQPRNETHPVAFWPHWSWVAWRSLELKINHETLNHKAPRRLSLWNDQALGSHCMGDIHCIQILTVSPWIPGRPCKTQERELRAMFTSPLYATLMGFAKANTYHEPRGTRRTCSPWPAWQSRNAILPR